MVNLSESKMKQKIKIEKYDLNKVKEVLEKIAPGSTEQISIPISVGQITGKKPWILIINVGSVEKKLCMYI